MAQTTSLLKTLKKVLKAHGLTYAKVAPLIGLSEASVKRIFAEERLSLQRLDQICQIMDMEISDLVQEMGEQQVRLQRLTSEQEKELTQDVKLLLVTVCALNKWSMGDILEHFLLDESECIQYLAKLDRLKIIELLPKNKIKLLVAPNFNWIENGPIQRFFLGHIGQEYFDTSFDHNEECLIVLNGMLSQQSNAEFQRKLERLAREFDVLNNDDAALPVNERDGVTVVLGMRGWQYGLFKHLNQLT